MLFDNLIDEQSEIRHFALERKEYPGLNHLTKCRVVDSERKLLEPVGPVSRTQDEQSRRYRNCQIRSYTLRCAGLGRSSHSEQPTSCQSFRLSFSPLEKVIFHS